VPDSKRKKKATVISMPEEEPSQLNLSTDNLMNKSVHTRDGVLIGNIHAINEH
jgi:hypothetical protein